MIDVAPCIGSPIHPPPVMLHCQTRSRIPLSRFERIALHLPGTTVGKDERKSFSIQNNPEPTIVPAASWPGPPRPRCGSKPDLRPVTKPHASLPLRRHRYLIPSPQLRPDPPAPSSILVTRGEVPDEDLGTPLPFGRGSHAFPPLAKEDCSNAWRVAHLIALSSDIPSCLPVNTRGKSLHPSLFIFPQRLLKLPAGSRMVAAGPSVFVRVKWDTSAVLRRITGLEGNVQVAGWCQRRAVGWAASSHFHCEAVEVLLAGR